MDRNALSDAVRAHVHGVEPEHTQAVRRGRDAWAALRDAVQERRARGEADPVEIVVSRRVVGDMHAFIRFWSRAYDGVLPPICGVRVVEGMTGGSDAEMVVVRGGGRSDGRH